MKKLIFSLSALAILSGCASTTKTSYEPERQVYATPAERAFQTGVEFRMVQSCRAQLNPRLVAQYEESVNLMLTTYSPNVRQSVRTAFSRGLGTETSYFNKIPCEKMTTLLNEQLTCMDAETRKNLKGSIGLK